MQALSVVGLVDEGPRLASYLGVDGGIDRRIGGMEVSDLDDAGTGAIIDDAPVGRFATDLAVAGDRIALAGEIRAKDQLAQRMHRLPIITLVIAKILYEGFLVCFGEEAETPIDVGVNDFVWGDGAVFHGVSGAGGKRKFTRLRSRS